MRWLATFGIALRALRRTKARSLLTALGIIVGTAAVIAVVAVGQGASVMVRGQIGSMGSNLLIIFPGSMRAGGMHQAAGSRQSLSVTDGEAIASDCRGVTAVTPLLRAGGQVVYRSSDWSTGIMGVSPSFCEVRNWHVTEGAFFSDADVRSAARVCVLGSTVARELYAGDDPVGSTIRVRGMPFRVLGVLPPKGSGAFGQDQDDTVIAPWTTVRRVLQNSSFDSVNQLLVQVESEDALESVSDQVRGLLRQRHRIGEGEDDDFSVMNMTEVTQTITKVSDVMRWMLAAIASISLIVGGIGIMNIMLVSVSERTREIGLRMAVGARPRDIMLQFLVEASTLSTAGGMVGVGAGAVSANIITYLMKWPVLVSAFWVFMAVLSATAIGIIFGLYPAWRAARLNPIDCLRHE